MDLLPTLKQWHAEHPGTTTLTCADEILILRSNKRDYAIRVWQEEPGGLFYLSIQASSKLTLKYSDVPLSGGTLAELCDDMFQHDDGQLASCWLVSRDGTEECVHSVLDWLDHTKLEKRYDCEPGVATWLEKIPRYSTREHDPLDVLGISIRNSVGRCITIRISPGSVQFFVDDLEFDFIPSVKSLVIMYLERIRDGFYFEKVNTQGRAFESKIVFERAEVYCYNPKSADFWGATTGEWRQVPNLLL